MNNYDFQYINEYNGMRSPTGTDEGDRTTAYFMRCLYQRAISTLDFTIPAEWDKQYFLNVLYRNGFIGIIPTAEYGVIPQVCALSGYGIYLQPKTLLVAQPLVNFSGEIGKDCELIKLTPDYKGIWDIIEHYAVQLSTCYTSIRMSLINSRLAFLMAAKNKSAAETLKVIAEKISGGESVIVIDSKLRDDDDGNTPIWTEAYNPKDSYITDQLLQDMTCIINMFDREVGIPTVDQKRERMITGEVENLTKDSCARLETWKTCLSESIDRVNAMFPGLNISFKEVVRNEQHAEDDSDRDV